MSYFRRPNPRSNWKRPKPKIYDCNTRDMEKFYQTNYDEYLNTKSDIRSRELERERRGDAELLTRRFEQRRASSLVYGEDDAPRNHRFVPARQTSNDGSTSTEHSYLRTRLENSMDDGPSRDVRSSTSASRNVTFSNTLNAPDSNSEMASIETRLERLRKLREDLGLPSEVNANQSSGSASSMSSSSMYNSADSAGASSSRSRRQVSPPETRGRESSRWTSQGSTARSDSRSRASPARGAESSTYSSRTEQSTSSSLRNGLDDQGSSSYTSRSSRKTGGDTNGYSSSYDSSSSSKGRSRVEKPTLEGLDLDYDDEKLLTDVRKKFPSSKEILEKIRNMDIE